MRKGQCSKGILSSTWSWVCNVCVHMCTRVHPYVHVYVCIRVCAHGCVHASTYVCLCTCMRACVCAGGGESSRASEFQAEPLLPSLRRGVTQEVGWGLGAAAFP